MSSSFAPQQRDPSTYPQDIQDHAKALGISPTQYWQIATNLPPSGEVSQLSGQGNQAWNVAPGGQSEATYRAVARFLRSMDAATNKGNQNQTTAPPSNVVAQDPTRSLENLGAAALEKVGLGGQAVYNPTPGQASAVSGVGKVQSPTYTTNPVSMPTINTPGVFTKAGSPITPSGTDKASLEASKLRSGIAQMAGVISTPNPALTFPVSGSTGKEVGVSPSQWQTISQNSNAPNTAALGITPPQQYAGGSPGSFSPSQPFMTQPTAQATGAPLTTAIPFGTVGQGVPPQQGGMPGMPDMANFGQMVANHAINNEIQRQTQMMQGGGNAPMPSAPGPQDRIGRTG
jgi:hypothetical protein